MDNDYLSTLIKHRTILLHQPIDANSATYVTAQILALNVTSKKPITLHISSPGGCIYSGLQIIDVMNFVESPIYVVASGLVASMGAIIFINGQPGYRFALPHCTFMLHEPASANMAGKVSDINVTIEELRRLRDVAEQMITTCTRIEGRIDRDRYLTAMEALRVGIVDQVLHTKKDRNYRLSPTGIEPALSP